MKFMREVAQSEQMKTYAKHFVFLKINADHNKPVMQAYEVSALPTHMVLDKDGAVLAKTVGYGNPQTFYNWLESNK